MRVSLLMALAAIVAAPAAGAEPMSFNGLTAKSTLDQVIAKFPSAKRDSICRGRIGPSSEGPVLCEFVKLSQYELSGYVFGVDFFFRPNSTLKTLTLRWPTLAVAAGGLAVAVVHLGLGIADRIKQPHGRLAESVAEMCLDNGVVECVVTTRDGQIRISRDDVPATNTVEARRLGYHSGRSVPRPSFPLDADPSIDEAVRASQRQAAIRGSIDKEFIAEVRPHRDGRVYTVVGYLTPPGARANVVNPKFGEFRTQSGKVYIARGIDWERAPQGSETPVVIRAEIVGEEGGHTVLNVSDVFEPEEP